MSEKKRMMAKQVKAYDDVKSAVMSLLNGMELGAYWELRYYKEAPLTPWYAIDDLGYENWSETIMEALAWLTSRN